jgi:flagellar protein FlaG
MNMEVSVIASPSTATGVGAAGGATPQVAPAVAAPGKPQRPVAPPAPNQVDAYLKAHTQSVRFQVDSETGMTIVNIYNEATGELVQQIPNEVVVRIAQYINSKYAAGELNVDVTA